MKATRLLFGALLCVGCAANAPLLRLERSSAAIREADALGAGAQPTARTYLQRARDEQEAARRMALQRDPRAETVLAASEADAELALSMAREAEAAQQEQSAAAQVATLHGSKP
jgi:hypothetical protein